MKILWLVLAMVFNEHGLGYVFGRANGSRAMLCWTANGKNLNCIIAFGGDLKKRPPQNPSSYMWYTFLPHGFINQIGLSWYLWGRPAALWSWTINQFAISRPPQNFVWYAWAPPQVHARAMGFTVGLALWDWHVFGMPALFFTSYVAGSVGRLVDEKRDFERFLAP